MIFRDIWRYMPIFAVLQQKLSFVNSVNSVVTGPNLTKILHNAEKLFMRFNLLKSKLRYCDTAISQRGNEDWSAKNADFAYIHLYIGVEAS